MRAIPTTRGKDKKFVRPEMQPLEALRLLFWPELPAPKEEAPPKPPEKSLFESTDDTDGTDEEKAEDIFFLSVLTVSSVDSLLPSSTFAGFRSR